MQALPGILSTARCKLQNPWMHSLTFRRRVLPCNGVKKFIASLGTRKLLLLDPYRQMQMQLLYFFSSALIPEFLFLFVHFLVMFSLLDFKFVFKQINYVLSLAEYFG